MQTLASVGPASMHARAQQRSTQRRRPGQACMQTSQRRYFLQIGVHADVAARLFFADRRACFLTSFYASIQPSIQRDALRRASIFSDGIFQVHGREKTGEKTSTNDWNTRPTKHTPLRGPMTRTMRAINSFFWRLDFWAAMCAVD